MESTPNEDNKKLNKYVSVGIFLDWAELYSVGGGLMAAPAP